MTYLLPEIHEKILVRLSVRDLIQCKSVSKSWLALIRSLIADAKFIKAHLNHSYLSDRYNNEIGDRRIVMTLFYGCTLYYSNKAFYQFCDSDQYTLLGASDGLVCISPSPTQVVVVNPATGEVKNIPKPQIPETASICWGFGFDSSMDDYKVVLAFKTDIRSTLFQVFSLRSNSWKVIGELYHVLSSRSGVLFKGALHWVSYGSSVIVSFHLSDEKYLEVPLPYIMTYEFGSSHLGIVDNCLCVYEDNLVYDNIWVLKDFNTDQQSWEFVKHVCRGKYHTVHRIKEMRNYIPNERTLYHETTFSPSELSLLGAPLFVESLESPHFHTRSTVKSPENGDLSPAEISDALNLEKVKLNDCVLELSALADAEAGTNDNASTSYNV